jgi:hypothetical protein
MTTGSGGEPDKSSSDDSDAKANRSRSSGRRPTRKLSERGLTALLVQNMNELTASHLEVRKTEAKKSSMMNKMGQETEKFFLVLSAKGWDKKDQN